MAVALQIRDVPEDVRDRLAASARARGQSLQAYLLALVTAEAQRSRNLAIVARFDDRRDGVTGTSDQIVAEIHAVRAERDARLGGEQ